MGSVGVKEFLALDWAVEPGVPATTEVAGLTDLASAKAWLTEAAPALRAALHEHGAVYLRGLPITSVEDFGQVRDTLMPARTPYREKATPRSDFGNGVFSSTDLPAAQAIRMHNENSYTLTFPGLLMFSCLIAPPEGGATPVADCRKVLHALPPSLVAKMRAHGWLLNRSYSEHISIDWQTAFAAKTPEDVERYCAENLISCQWHDDGHLRTSQRRPGVITHPVTGAEVWFNHLAFWNEWSLDEELRETLIDEFGRDDLPFNTALGDGTPLTREEMAALDAAYESATMRQRWQPGDLLLVDNILCTHGRDPFRGNRKIVVAMGEPVDVVDCAPTVQPAEKAVR
ncbi:TauD/TfdA family dioxygenase [Amycolatopsis sp. H20-H5]|uniref:TauD/TfdA family dioxygenase n=1 Tax=Amycolatopsis sp. H20-H5 TaxID=3046309 RepID=UPI002DBD0A68|nr:TauD/TfdA family dioxygenase [Amycolatopsis sp. H20-H5]MEC3978305.1 TauD/TfdA family dioxygenase [Amycolatopsis sp. H20-H5]